MITDLLYFLMQVILTTLTLVFSIISAVGGVFGMNLKSGIEEDEYAFYIVTTLSIVAAVGAFLAIIIYCRQKRLMFMGVPSKI
jgi:magnesium transporter